MIRSAGIRQFVAVLIQRTTGTGEARAGVTLRLLNIVAVQPRVQLLQAEGGRRAVQVNIAAHAAQTRTGFARASMSCVDIKIVMPSSASSRYRRVSVVWVGASTPVNGSSSSSREGPAARARAKRTLWR